MTTEQKHCDAFDHVAAWDRAAEPWNTFVESGTDYHRTELHGPALFDACRPVNGKTALDLGCGQGWFTRDSTTGG